MTDHKKNNNGTDHLFLKACRREPVSRTPVWFMRQAGRYLPEYRAVRSKVDFLTLCKTPELAAEVTVQPVDIIGVDAAIIFSDILVIPEAMGMELIVEENKGGPKFPSPLRTRAAIERLQQPDPYSDLKYVLDALHVTRRCLNGRVPLIGFSGAPWTLATYMVEGQGSKNFRYIKEWMFTQPADIHRLLDKLTKAVIAYLKAQIESGAQAVQIFDTWGGILSREDFREFSLPYITRIVSSVRTTGVPVIVFCKDCGQALEEIIGTGADVIGIDWTTDMRVARERVSGRAAIQGNLDPTMLYAPIPRIEDAVSSILQYYGHGAGHIFNLGHGILPDTPVDNVRAFVDAVKRLSPAYHT
ncbi:uroporphyrinogen decarboxylase [bacterium]|nr:MAG: uroporphyrinogen decarboxylase [bacterium]